jgi:hypothetical protein
MPKRAHPEWIAADSEGKPLPHWSMPGVWVTCALGSYNFDFMNRVNREIMDLYSVDAIFCNRWSGSGMCFCESCRSLFKEYSGLEIPVNMSRDDDAMITYLEWREKRLFQLCEFWDSEIRSINGSSRFIPNSGGGVNSDLDMIRLGKYSDVLFIDRQARHGIMPPWGNGRNGKELRSVMGRKPIGGIFSTGNEEEFRWKDSVQNEPELRLWVAEAVANGMSPWFTKFCGRVYDNRWMPVVEDLYTTYAKWEPYLSYNEPVADAAIVFSQNSSRYYARNRRSELVDSPISGFYQVLLEDRTLFEMVHAKNLSLESLKPFKTVILPNVAGLSNDQCEVLRQYVYGGGGLVATFESSLYDEKGVRRKDFGLSDLFHAHSTADKVQGPMKNSYIKINHNTLMDVTLLHRGLEDAGRIINGVFRVPVASDKTSGPFSLVPPYVDLPMEEVYPPETGEECPEIFCNTFGEGRVVYFTGDIDRRFWEYLTPDHGKILSNSILWTMKNSKTVDIRGKGFLDITCWRSGTKVSIHIVNMTNPFAMRGVVRDIYPVSGLELRLSMQGDIDGSVKALAAGKDLKSGYDGKIITIQLPEIDVHEVLVFNLVNKKNCGI